MVLRFLRVSGVEPDQVNTLEIISPIYDPLTKQLISRMGLYKRSRAATVGLVLGALVYLITPALEGNFLPSSRFSALRSWPAIYQWLVFIPGLFVYALSYHPEGINRVSAALARNGVFSVNETEIITTVTRSWSSLRNWPMWLTAILAAGLAAGVHAYGVVQYALLELDWYSSSLGVFFGFRLPVVFLALYLLFLVVLQHVKFAWLTWRLFGECELRMRPLDPDGAGGFGMLGRFSLSMIYLIVGLMLLIASLGAIEYLTGIQSFSNPSIQASMAAYLVLAPLIFFLPLYPAHRAMQKAKKKSLSAIAPEFQEVFEDSKFRLLAEKRIEYEQQRLEVGFRLLELVGSFPAWPLNTQTLRRFIAVFLFPMFTGVLVELIARLLTE